MSKKIAACVVLYNPSLQVISNIQSYYPHVDCLIAVDNSERQNGAITEALQHNLNNVIYKFLNKNLYILGFKNLYMFN